MKRPSRIGRSSARFRHVHVVQTVLAGAVRCRRPLPGTVGAETARTRRPLAFGDAGYVLGILDDAGFEEAGLAREAVEIIGPTSGNEAAVACKMGPSGAPFDEHHADDATRHATQQEIAKACAA